MHHLPLPLLLSLLSLLLPPIHTLPVPLPLPIPPNIPTLSTALNALSTLTIRPQGSSTGYDRDQFPHWETQPGSACNTRELVLARDGVNVVQDPASCAATSGIWRSPFDGATWRAPGDVDVDHLVPLSNAWRSGASDWSLARRRAFANDLVNPELIAVTDNVNQEKGSSGPEDWRPPLTSYHCTYARMWTFVKSQYDLSVTQDEFDALREMLDTC